MTRKHHGSSGSRNDKAWNWLPRITFHDEYIRDDDLECTKKQISLGSLLITQWFVETTILYQSAEYDFDVITSSNRVEHITNNIFGTPFSYFDTIKLHCDFGLEIVCSPYI